RCSTISRCATRSRAMRASSWSAPSRASSPASLSRDGSRGSSKGDERRDTERAEAQEERAAASLRSLRLGVRLLGYADDVTATPAEAELPFTKLGDWDVLAHIADGGMAHVYLGRKTADPSRFAALKVIRPELARNKAF